MHEDTLLGFCPNSKVFLLEIPKQGQNHYSKPLLGIFEIFRGGKGTPHHKTKKLYFLDSLPTHQSRQFVLERFFQISLFWEITVFGKNSKSGENAKGTKLTNLDRNKSWMEHQI
jgi:hypothetical protein